MFSKALLAALTLALSIVGAVAVPAAAEATDLVSLSAQGGLAVVRDPLGTRIYYQPANNGQITEYCTSDFFDVGQSVQPSPLPLSQASEALAGTPIAAVAFKALSEIHVFFLSPERVLSEYYWTGSVWRGGSSCSECITTLGITIAEANEDSLYASIDPLSNVMAVGFFLATNPDTLTEAVKRGADWVLAPLPGF